MLNTPTIDLVIMTFSKELPMLKLHVESLHTNFDIGYINKIFLLINDKNSPDVIKNIEQNYLDLFKYLKNKVSIIDGLDLIGDFDYYTNSYKDISSGNFINREFLSQMITDCAISKIIQAEYYLVVDSKSLYCPYKFSDRLIKNEKIYFPMGPIWSQRWEANKEYFNAPDLYPGFEPTAVRPQIYHSKTMYRMLKEVETKSGLSWAKFLIKDFATKNQVSGISHYYLYFASFSI
jgi:hypothetical protein